MKQSATTTPTVAPTTRDECPGRACTSVFVVDKNNVALMPCHPGRARVLLEKKRADVYKMHPFTIRILDREDGVLQAVELKVDPGSKTTGVALMVKGAVRGGHSTPRPKPLISLTEHPADGVLVSVPIV